MAKEIKSFKCNPDYEQDEIEFRQKVGWEFVSTQEIYNKDTHMESSIFSDSVTSVTETVHYVKLTFQRERKNVNPELLDLEQRIDNFRAPKPPKTWGGLLILGGFAMYIIPGILMLRSNNKKKKQYEIEYKEWSDEFNRLLARVDELQD